MKISMILVTYKRARMVEKVLKLNLASAGATLDEFIWVDNGFDNDAREMMKQFNPDVSILHRENLGVAVAFNRGVACSTGDSFLINDGDVIFPDGWLATIKKYLMAIPNTGVISIPNVEVGVDNPVDFNSLPIRTIGGLPVHVTDIKIGENVKTRKIWQKVGYLQEGLGLYGKEDSVWNERGNKFQGEFVNYIIPNFFGNHVGNGIVGEPENQEDWAFKVREALKEGKEEKIAELRKQGLPYFNPYM